MTVLAIAHDIDEDVFVELVSVFVCYFHALVHEVRFVGVDMEDRCPNHFSYFCAIVGRTGLIRISRKAYLVVHHDVDDAARCIIL